MTNLTDACADCPGRCCTRKFGWGSVHLTDRESRHPIFAPFLGSNSDGDPILVLGKSACHFLDHKTKRCKIYGQRPVACRGFVCHDGDEFSRKVIHEKFPALRKHLKRHGLLPDPPPPGDYFWTECQPDAMAWHLRDLRGRFGAHVWRYSSRTFESEFVGWFDSDGLFYRRHI